MNDERESIRSNNSSGVFAADNGFEIVELAIPSGFRERFWKFCSREIWRIARDFSENAILNRHKSAQTALKRAPNFAWCKRMTNSSPSTISNGPLCGGVDCLNAVRMVGSPVDEPNT